MTVFEARRWIIVASLVIAGAAFSFFVIAPVLGYPLRFSQAMSILQIVFPVFLGYLACFAVPLFIQNAGDLVWVLTVGLLVAGVVGARLTRSDRLVAAGLGCGVVAAFVVVLALSLFLVLWINFGTLP